MLDAEDDSVSRRLLQLADSRTARAGRNADLLRSMAAELRESVSEALVLVDATYLAIASRGKLSPWYAAAHPPVYTAAALAGMLPDSCGTDLSSCWL